MPFQSQEQWRKFGELLTQGKITQATFDEWAHSSPDFKDLPKYKSPAKPAGKSARRKKR